MDHVLVAATCVLPGRDEFGLPRYRLRVTMAFRDEPLHLRIEGMTEDGTQETRKALAEAELDRFVAMWQKR